jgi:hypothetical protein
VVGRFQQQPERRAHRRGGFHGGTAWPKGNCGDEPKGGRRHGPERSLRYCGVRRSVPWRRSDRGRLCTGWWRWGPRWSRAKSAGELTGARQPEALFGDDNTIVDEERVPKFGDYRQLARWRQAAQSGRGAEGGAEVVRWVWRRKECNTHPRVLLIATISTGRWWHGGGNGGRGNNGGATVWTPARGLGTIIRTGPLIGGSHVVSLFFPNYQKPVEICKVEIRVLCWTKNSHIFAWD